MRLPQLVKIIVHVLTWFSEGLDPITFLTWFHWAPWTKCSVCVNYILLQCLEVHGFSSEILANQLIGFASDDASVIFVSHSVVAKKGQQAFPNVIIWNCFNQCLELGFGDTIAEIKENYSIFQIIVW